MPARTRILALNEGEDGSQSSTAYELLGARLARNHRERLAKLAGVDPVSDLESLTLAAFSAGWGFVEHVLRAPGPLPDAVLAADAYYTNHSLRPKPGYRELAEHAAAGRTLAVFTTSDAAGAKHPSAKIAVAALLEGIELEPRRAPAPVPTPARALGTGGLLWLHYPGARAVDHSRHATHIAPAVLSHIVAPYLEARRRAFSAPAADGITLDAVLVAAGLWWMVTG